jgi:hypothetical protein
MAGRTAGTERSVNLRARAPARKTPSGDSRQIRRRHCPHTMWQWSESTEPSSSLRPLALLP